MNFSAACASAISAAKPPPPGPRQARRHRPRMMEEAQIAALLECFRQHPHFLITAHARPDGDAIGSILALAELLEQLGCTTDPVLADPTPHIYRSLPGIHRIRQAAALDPAEPLAP